MTMMLEELQKLLDLESTGDAIDYVEIGIQSLMYHQIIYEDTVSIPKQTFEILKRNRLFFEKYFASAGLLFNYSLQYQMFWLEPKPHSKSYATTSQRLKKDETTIRIALRLLFEEGIRTGNLDEISRVQSSYSDLDRLYRNLSGKPAPTHRTLKEKFLKQLHKYGAIRILDSKDSLDTKFLILPGIRVYVSDEYINQLSDIIREEE